jgi:hypothetical protein
VGSEIRRGSGIGFLLGSESGMSMGKREKLWKWDVKMWDVKMRDVKMGGEKRNMKA